MCTHHHGLGNHRKVANKVAYAVALISFGSSSVAASASPGISVFKLRAKFEEILKSSRSCDWVKAHLEHYHSDTKAGF